MGTLRCTCGATIRSNESPNPIGGNLFSEEDSCCDNPISVLECKKCLAIAIEDSATGLFRFYSPIDGGAEGGVFWKR